VVGAIVLVVDEELADEELAPAALGAGSWLQLVQPRVIATANATVRTATRLGIGPT
jgi:hypothetical protein